MNRGLSDPKFGAEAICSSLLLHDSSFEKCSLTCNNQSEQGFLLFNTPSIGNRSLGILGGAFLINVSSEYQWRDTARFSNLSLNLKK